jgi:hypothetical protein
MHTYLKREVYHTTITTIVLRMSSATQPTTPSKYKEQDFYNNVTNKDDIKTILDLYEIEIEKEREDVEHFCEIMSEIKEDYSHVPNIVTVIKRISFYVVNNAISNSK